MFKVQKTNDNLSTCSCLRCPSYNECARKKEEKLYCSGEVERSICDYKMNGCVCGSCVVHLKNDLKNGYYCIKGSADEIG